MLFLQNWTARIQPDRAGSFHDFVEAISPTIRPLIRTAQASQLSLVGNGTSKPKPHSRASESRRGSWGEESAIVFGEVFTDGETLCIATISNSNPGQEGGIALAFGTQGATDAGVNQFKLDIAYVGTNACCPFFEKVRECVRDVLGAELKGSAYRSRRFDELKAEGRDPPPLPSGEEQRCAIVLSNRESRSLAVAIKASGGLLVKDLPRQLASVDPDRVAEIHRVLLISGIVTSETVIICTRTHAQVARLPSRDALPLLTTSGLKCACGRPIADEMVEEALTISTLGHSLLEKSRWFSVLLVDALRRVGVAEHQILLEQQIGADEFDCLANLSGELVLFELKDKEFNLGNAYSFGAKIGIIRPDHSVIVTTEKVGNDAKDHFERARTAAARSRAPEPYIMFEPIRSDSIEYIEGVEELLPKIQSLANGVYTSDARRLLANTLPLAALDAALLLSVVGDRNTREAARKAPAVTAPTVRAI
jgi:hypothetical protein